VLQPLSANADAMQGLYARGRGSSSNLIIQGITIAYKITQASTDDEARSCSDHTRLQNVFKDNGVKTLDDLLCLNVYEVVRWHKLGKKGLWHIINGLAHFGLHLHAK